MIPYFSISGYRVVKSLHHLHVPDHSVPFHSITRIPRVRQSGHIGGVLRPATSPDYLVRGLQLAIPPVAML